MSDAPVEPRGRGALLTLLLGLWVAVACGEDKNGPRTGSNSNWLIACVEADECGRADACLCGACSAECSNDADCADLENARCSTSDETAATAQCGASGSLAGTGLCLPRCTPGSCPANQSCADGGCVLAEIPDLEFCAPVRSPSQEDRAREDELLDLLQQSRVDGTLACASGASVDPSPALRLDGHLACAARIKALDQATTGTSGPVDSQGRDAAERIDLSGYQVSSWWESYAFDATNVDRAFELLLEDDASCPELGNPTYSAVGVGAAGDVFVVTLASE